MRFAAVAVLVAPLAWADPGIELEFLGQTEIPGDLEVDGTRVGGLSGLAYDPGCDLFYAASDDRGNFGPPRIYVLRLSPDAVPSTEIIAAVVLRGEDGSAFSDGDFDLEALALATDGSLYLATEGVPHRGVAPMVARFHLDGSFARGLELPDHYLPTADGTRGVRNNHGFEGMALSPDEKWLFVAAENALIQDGPLADIDIGSPARVLVFDRRTERPVGEYVYQVGAVPDVPQPAGAFRTNGISEIVGIGGRRVLVLERSFSAGVGNRARLFAVELGSQTSEYAVGGPPTSLTKKLVADLEDFGVDPDNLEAMAFGPMLADGRRMLVMLADNNFQPSVQANQVLFFAVSGVPAPVVDVPEVTIPEIQGAGHVSPYVGRCVTGARGVVTAILGQRRGQAFWLQDVAGDDTPETSDGVLVTALEGTDEIAVGDQIEVSGRVEERSWGLELPVTRIVASRIDVQRGGRPLPEPVILGEGGVVIPRGEVASRRLREFDPSRFAADAFESLEGMRVLLGEAVVVGPTSRHGEFAVVADGGRGSAPWTAAGGLRRTPCNVHPQRVIVDDRLVQDPPDVAVGDVFAEPIAGILHYSYGSYKLLNTEPLPKSAGVDLEGERTALVGDDSHLTMATFNLENLWAGSDVGKFARVADVIVNHLANPDVLAVQEVQDDTGPEDDGTVSAAITLRRLVEAVERAGGVRYEWRSIDPTDNSDGGQPGANIRVALLFNPDRVEFVEREDCAADRGVRLNAGFGLNCSPGLVDPTNRAFAPGANGRGGSRKPLVGEFRFRGRTVYVVNLHLGSKGGDDPVFGRRQPPVTASTERRNRQTAPIAEFVERILADDPGAGVVVLGDLNDFEGSQPLQALEAAGLEDLIERVAGEDRYSYIYLGASQVLDHILVSEALVGGVEVDAVHVNADFPAARRASDHDPVVVRLAFERLQ